MHLVSPKLKIVNIIIRGRRMTTSEVNMKNQKQHRILTVEPAYWRAGEDMPKVAGLRLGGRWMERAGFQIGDAVKVHARNGRIYITRDDVEEQQARRT